MVDKYQNVPTTNLPNSIKLQEKIDEYGSHEIFLAQKIILCEGKDDYFAIKEYLENEKIDIEAMSISILSCGGFENILDFAKIASDMKIPFCAVTDTDLDDGKYQKLWEISCCCFPTFPICSRRQILLTWFYVSYFFWILQ